MEDKKYKKFKITLVNNNVITLNLKEKAYPSTLSDFHMDNWPTIAMVAEFENQAIPWHAVALIEGIE